MKETGLMFKAPLVRAILSGQKAQTRRVWKMPRGCMWYEELGGEKEGWVTDADQPWWIHVEEFRCPMGRPGDHIYVRETWAEVARRQPLTDEDLPMRQDGRIVVYEADPHWRGARQFLCADGCIRWALPDRWKPSIHMRKRDARIWLEVTGVRVERLQEISEADCIAEGIEFFNNDRECGCKNYMDETGKDWTLTPLQSFQSLWESTDGDWAANPWVWVTDFKRIDKPAPKEAR